MSALLQRLLTKLLGVFAIVGIVIASFLAGKDFAGLGVLIIVFGTIPTGYLVKSLAEDWAVWNYECPHGRFAMRADASLNCPACRAEIQKSKAEVECQLRQIEQKKRETEGQLRHIENLRVMNPYEFESFILSIYRRLGWEIESTPPSHDEGIDGYLRKGTEKIVIQCKRNSATSLVGAPILYALLGVVEKTRSTKGILVTTSLFTRQAEKWAKGEPKLELIDQSRLLDLIEQALARLLPFFRASRRAAQLIQQREA